MLPKFTVEINTGTQIEAEDGRQEVIMVEMESELKVRMNDIYNLLFRSTGYEAAPSA